MQIMDWLQLIIFIAILTALVKPVGVYLYRVLDQKEKTGLEFAFSSLERITYKLCSIDPQKEQNWKEYLFALMMFSLAAFVFMFTILGIQQFLPLNPEKFGSITWDLNFNTTASFITNTDWQSYSGETTLSYFSQMFTLTVQNFVSASVGVAVAAALARGIARASGSGLGNFWVDLVRSTYYLFIPLSLVLAIFLISEGVPQNFNNYASIKTLEAQQIQTIVQGPIASQDAIKLLGSNGGGFTDANAAHPYENPTPLSNLVQILAILLIPAAQTYYYGKTVGHQKHGWYIYLIMLLLLVAGIIVTTFFEREGNLNFSGLGVDMSAGNLEGKEQRFGLFGSTLFATGATASSNGTSNSMFSSYTPYASLVLFQNMQVGEIIFGGVGSGLYGIILISFVGIFIAGLIIGRTPEYLGKKIEAYEIKMSVIPLLLFIILILGCTSWACMSDCGRCATGNRGPHELSEILFAFTSTTANNGSAFSSLSTNTPWYNITTGLVMLASRFLCIVATLALAGGLVKKKRLPESIGSFPVEGLTFVFLMIGIIVLTGGLGYLSSLIFGPILEQLYMYKGTLF